MHRLIIFLSFLVLSTVYAVEAEAPAAPETETTVMSAITDIGTPTPGYTSVNRYITGEVDYVASGVFSDLYYWFYVPDTWQLSTNNYLFLVLSCSPMLITPDSTVTVYLNDVPIKTTLLPALNPDRDFLKVELPRESIKQDYNELRLRFYLRVIDKECRDVDNPAAWTAVHKESALHLEYKVPTGKYDLSAYPYPFIMEGVKDTRSAAFVVPDDPTSAEIEAAVSIIAYLTSLNPLARYDYEIYTEKSLPADARNGNLIMIGEKDRNKTAAGYKDIPAPKKGEGVIAIYNSPANPDNAVLVVGGGDAEGLTRAARVLSSRVYSGQLEGASEVIRGKLYDKTEPEDKYRKGTIRLSELGYGDMETRGAYRSIVTFTFSVPPHIRLLKGSSLNVVFSHSPLVKADLSTLSIEINSIPVKAVALTEENSERAVMKVPIPDNLLENDFFKIDARFYLDLGLKDCAHEYVEAAWGVIHQDTYFELEYEITANPTLDQFPGLFIDYSGQFDGYIVVPDKVEPGALKLLSAMAVSIGRNLEGNTGRIAVTKSADAGGREKDGNLILIGTPANVKLLSEAASKLPVKFDKKGIPEPNDKAPFLKEYVKNRALMEVAVSPFAANKFILVISGDDASLAKTAETISDDRLYRALDGNAAITDGTEKSQSFTTFEEKVEIGLPVTTAGPPLYLIIIIIVAGLLAIAVIIYLVIRLGRKKK